MKSRIFRRDRRQAGFTLIELLVTLAVLAILIGAALSRYQRISDKAWVAAAKFELHEAMRGIWLYQTENDSMAYPTTSMITSYTELSQVIDPFVGSLPAEQNSKFTFVSYSANDTSFSLVGKARDSQRSILTVTRRGITIAP